MPLNATLTVDGPAVSTTVSELVAAPGLVGAKRTTTAQLAPGATGPVHEFATKLNDAGPEPVSEDAKGLGALTPAATVTVNVVSRKEPSATVPTLKLDGGDGSIGDMNSAETPIPVSPAAAVNADPPPPAESDAIAVPISVGRKETTMEQLAPAGRLNVGPQRPAGTIWNWDASGPVSTTLNPARVLVPRLRRMKVFVCAFAAVMPTGAAANANGAGANASAERPWPVSVADAVPPGVALTLSEAVADAIVVGAKLTVTLQVAKGTSGRVQLFEAIRYAEAPDPVNEKFNTPVLLPPLLRTVNVNGGEVLPAGRSP